MWILKKLDLSSLRDKVAMSGKRKTFHEKMNHCRILESNSYSNSEENKYIGFGI